MDYNIETCLRQVLNVTLKSDDGMSKFTALSCVNLLNYKDLTIDEKDDKIWENYNIYIVENDYIITKEYIDAKLYVDCDVSIEYTDLYISINDFLNGKEPQLYKRYKIPVMYRNWGLSEIMGKSLEDATRIAIDNTDDLPLPEYPDYMDDSMMVDIDVIEKDIGSSKDLTDEDIVILTEFYNQFN